MAATPDQPVSTGNLSAMLMSMSQRFDGFCERHLSASGTMGNLQVISSEGVTLGGSTLSLPAGTYLLDVEVSSGSLTIDGSEVASGSYVIGGGSYTIGTTGGSTGFRAVLNVVQLRGGGRLLAAPAPLREAA